MAPKLLRHSTAKQMREVGFEFREALHPDELRSDMHINGCLKDVCQVVLSPHSTTIPSQGGHMVQYFGGEHVAATLCARCCTCTILERVESWTLSADWKAHVVGANKNMCSAECAMFPVWRFCGSFLITGLARRR